MNSNNPSTINLDPFYRNSIGMACKLRKIFKSIECANNGNYPPYNIIQHTDDQFEIEVAVAGFNKNDIIVEVDEDNVLSIRGIVGTLYTAPGTVKETSEAIHRKDIDDVANGRKGYLHHGISAREFSRRFALAEHVEVVVAGMQDGILTIALHRIGPEKLKRKVIEIK